MVLNRQLETTMVMFNSYVIVDGKTIAEVDSYVSFGKKITRYGALTSRVQIKDCAWLGNFQKSL